MSCGYFLLDGRVAELAGVGDPIIPSSGVSRYRRSKSGSSPIGRRATVTTPLTQLLVAAGAEYLIEVER